MRIGRQLAAVEDLARRWLAAVDRGEAPEGFVVPEDAAVAALEIQRALDRVGHGTR